MSLFFSRSRSLSHLMKKYDHIVAGSGISGLTMALLLSMTGSKVLLIEKSPIIGGSLSRFSRKGVWFDTGFHFTGGMHEGGILCEILSVLGIRDAIEPVFLPASCQNQFVFESQGRRFEHPSGIDNIMECLKGYFPNENAAIDRYFEMVGSVCDRTPSLNLRENVVAPASLDEDFISLDTVLRQLTSDELLRGLLSGYAMCYGVRPAEMSFANHARVVQSFYQSIAFVRDGGDAFVAAFRERLERQGVDILCNTFITELADISGSRVGRFILNTGEELQADSCILTFHPQSILSLLPKGQYSKAFGERVSAFEPSVGLFSAFARFKEGAVDPLPDTPLMSIFPDADLNNLLDPSWKGTPALIVVKAPESGQSGKKSGICIVEPSFPHQVEQWSDTRTGKRPQSYLDYKNSRLEEIREHLFSVVPAYRDSLEFLDAGSVLTFRDYLCSPDGAAYGIKQKMGQFNLVGKLPLHNMYAAGQSSLLPGIIGAMMSSLIVGRAIIGKDNYGKILDGAL